MNATSLAARRLPPKLPFGPDIADAPTVMAPHHNSRFSYGGSRLER
jgi:hypothetical protein